MYIEFRDKKLLKCFESEKERKKELGELSDRFYNILKKLEAIESSHELYTQHKYLKPHPYDDKRVSVNLTQSKRLMFWFRERENGTQYIEIDKIHDPHS